MQQNNQAAQNLLSEAKLRLQAPPQQGGKKNATLSVKVYQNNPRLEVRTNVPNDRDFGRITAALDTLTFFALSALIRRVAAGPSDTKEFIENKSTFVNGQKVQTPEVVSKIVVGKDKEGVVYLAVTAKDRPMFKFDILPSEWHYLKHGDGKPFEKDELSVIWAEGWCKTFEALVPFILHTEFKPAEFQPRPGGGGKGNWNNNRNKPQQSSSSDDSGSSGEDDLPF